MSLIGKPIISRASKMSGHITGIESDDLKITFTKMQEISVPLKKAEDLLILDEETLNELRALIKTNQKNPTEKTSKVPTYIDDYQEEEYEEDPDDENEPEELGMVFREETEEEE
ncbi:MAG: hypothetical protein IJL85_04550 [Erysipelotrichaceae bacterium]|nr:hypothetical protein [Erysipelotrichaceae bacterium]